MEKKLVCNFLDNLGIVFVFVWYIFIDNKMKSYIYVFLLYGEKKNINVIENNKIVILLLIVL